MSVEIRVENRRYLVSEVVAEYVHRLERDCIKGRCVGCKHYELHWNNPDKNTGKCDKHSGLIYPSSIKNPSGYCDEWEAK